MTSSETTRLPACHTPGPWHYHSHEDGKPICNHGKFAIAYMDAYTPDEDDGGLWQQETEANGNLVAAAPDLLECLQDILAVFNQAATHSAGTHAIIGFFGDHDDSINRALHWRQKTRTAIAKATCRPSGRRAA
ncbi:MAG TPA: hypothetical protein VNX28_10010 [Gemmataceae bacterium]|jgi:hypothetical protein|nr:hypothetical protein [Gemmataceae bacterium]